MALILDLWPTDGTRTPLVAENKVMEVLLVVDLTHYLGQTLRDNRSILRLHGADTETLAKQQLLAEGSCNSLASSAVNNDR
jgi:hypothetical protein